MRDLSEVRVDIDSVDSKIRELYLKRLSLSKEVIDYKIANKKAVFDPVREKEKLEKLTGDIENEDVKYGVQRLFNKIMADSRRLQYGVLKEMESLDFNFGFKEIRAIDGKDSIVIYQGEPGAYSQAASKEFFGNTKAMTNVSTWRDAMEAVKSQKADFCVLPIENSTAGSVTEIYDLLSEYDLTIVGEQVIPIEHMLLGVPGSDISQIKTVFSHPQALMQCDSFLNSNSQMTPIKMLNTAAAAKKVCEDKDSTQAAIAGRINAEIYGLEILKSSIQNENNNMTRFIILSKDKTYLKDAKKLSISFCLQHEKGSLYNALSYLSDNGINLSLIESRPIKEINWEYRFFIDIDGNLNDNKVQWALSGLVGVTRDLKILGNY